MINRFLKTKKTAFFIYFLLNFLFITSLQAQQFTSLANNTSQIIKSDFSTNFSLLKKEYDTSLQRKDTLNMVKSLITISQLNRKNLKYGDAFNRVGEALFLAEESKDTLLMAKSYEEFGVLNYLYKQDNEVKINFTKAHSYYKISYKKNRISKVTLFQSYYNLVVYNQRVKHDKTLLKYIDSCYSFSDIINKKPILKIYLKEKKSSIQKREGNLKYSLKTLLEAEKAFELIDSKTPFTDTEKSFLIILYGRIGNEYTKLNKLDLAKSYFEKSVSTNDTTGENIFYKSYIHNLLSNLLAIQGDYKLAYENELKSNEINFKYLNPRNDNNIGFLMIKNRYKDELLKKNTLLNAKNIEISEKTSEILRFQIFFVIALLLITFIGFMIRSRIRSLKHEKATQNSQELLNIKNKELTTSTLQLIEKEEIVKTLKDHLKKTNFDAKTKALLKSVENQSTSLWDSFNSRFSALNKGFYERLQKRVPDLTSADLKLCALIKLNFTGKEMAYLLGISLGSVHVARHRLRKKIKLERHENLTSFITSI